VTGRKTRADQALVDQGLVASREQGKRLIMAGQVSRLHNGSLLRVDKPGQLLPGDTVLSIARPPRYVSRGGEKLLTALEHFELSVYGLTALDVGASTGGFTDCLLQHGAEHVFAVDVGKGQLDWNLRQDSRVSCLEGVNFRHADRELLPGPVDLVTADCSFISLRLILPACLRFCKPGARIIALIKPQFEAGPGRGVKGVIRDNALRENIVNEIIEFACHQLGLTTLGVVPSRVLGPKGNQEYLALFAVPASLGTSEEHGNMK
jgi:23S rRNA (cytidine1920-2'-O)/16S rRNA (cytidine1409-2'-O)-methyltransferase